jgi:oligopeptide/dipeptide ABC transporter ATP-binding protein
MPALARNPDSLLTLDGVHKAFGVVRRRGLGVERKLLRAINGVSFAIRAGESFGIVGESGSGKSTLARLVMGIEKPTGGVIRYRGEDVVALTHRNRRAYWREVQIVFQDPFSSLNPRMRIGNILSEPLRNFSDLRADRCAARIEELLVLVGLPVSAARRFPHELSGGQRQRVAIAAALAADPKVIIADEAVSALDVSVQAQIVNLLVDLRTRLGLTYIFITHDLNLCAYFCDRIAVLYLGQVMEICSAERLLSEPLHPYSRALISAVPSIDAGRRRRRIILSGEIPSPIEPPPGCPFEPRCGLAVPKCNQERPPLVDVGDSRRIACHVVADQMRARPEVK